MAMITQEMLSNLKPSQTINGVILVKNYSIALTKTNKEYITGTLTSGTDVSFKVWGNATAFSKMKNEEYSSLPCLISGTVDGFGGVNTIIIDNIDAVEGFTADQFFPIKYNIEAYWDALKKIISAKTSEKAQILANKILFDTELRDRFKVEFAAMSHHDNCKGGLLAHTYKVLRNVDLIINQYQDFVKTDGTVNKDITDLIYIGALLHDIGKTKEMNFGVYQQDSFATHSYFGVEMISAYRDIIIESYNEHWYLSLVSILLQHHGDFGEPCKTVPAYIVHRADELDSSLTLLAQNIETAVDDSRGKRVKLDGKYLSLY